ncbi:MAG: hypothetical protein ACI8W8_000711 [Rhodothermales bacterium]|jgi:hypothetical protein
MHKGWSLFLIVLGLLGLMLLAFWKLLAINLASSQYAEYSTLRSDPLGTKVLFRGYEALPEITATRWIQPLHLLKPEKSTVLFLGVGAGWGWDSTPELRTFQRLATDGNRVLVTLGDVPDYRLDPAEDKEEPEDEEEAPPPPEPLEDDEQEEELSDDARLDLGITIVPHEPGLPSCTEAATDFGAPPPWHASVALKLDEDHWTPLVIDESGAVWMAEQRLGSGSIVIAADSYWLSNEAMSNNRSTNALLWVLGEHQNVIFDESHLGVSTTLGVVGLAKRYRMHGIVLGLLVLVILYIWRASSVFLPDQPLPEEESAGIGRDGLTALLRRNIPLRELLTTCYGVWQDSRHHVPEERVTQIDQLSHEDLPKKDQAATILYRYRTICRLVAGKD